MGEEGYSATKITIAEGRHMSTRRHQIAGLQHFRRMTGQIPYFLKPNWRTLKQDNILANDTAVILLVKEVGG
jgi:hypothetical protein